MKFWKNPLQNFSFPTNEIRFCPIGKPILQLSSFEWVREQEKRGHTNCLSVAAEMSLLGVVTRASSHPVGSKSFAWAAPESNVVPTASVQIPPSSNPFLRIKSTKMILIYLPCPEGTMAKAKAFCSSIENGSTVLSFSPWCFPKWNIKNMKHR